jgi:hypothetical protein
MKSHGPGIIIASTVVIIAWLVPDIISSDPALPLQRLGTATGTNLIAMAARPVTAALILLAALSPLSRFPASVFFILAGLTGLAIPYLFGEPALPVGGLWALGIACGTIIAAAGAARKFGKTWVGMTVLSLFPAVCLVFAIVGIANGENPPSFATPFKEAVSLFAITATVFLGWRGLRHSE